MKKIIRLTESDLIRIVNRVIKEEEEETSADTCSVNISKSKGDTAAWDNMDTNTKNQTLKKIQTDIINYISRAKEEYKKWFKDPKTIRKFQNHELRVLDRLPNYLDQITKINLHMKGPNSMPTANAWVNSKNPQTINYNVPSIHDGKNYTHNLYDTTKHEMGHLIDYFFKKNGIKTYLTTINTDGQESYNANYIVNDQDQYTRLNVFREYIGAGPSDSPKILLSKFLNTVKSGKLSSNKFNFEGVTMEKGYRKNSTEEANQIFSKIGVNGILSGQIPAYNISQLFSNFAFTKGSDIFVSFNSIAGLNVTSKATPNLREIMKYYYLKLSPK